MRGQLCWPIGSSSSTIKPLHYDTCTVSHTHQQARHTCYNHHHHHSSTGVTGGLLKNSQPSACMCCRWLLVRAYDGNVPAAARGGYVTNINRHTHTHITVVLQDSSLISWINNHAAHQPGNRVGVGKCKHACPHTNTTKAADTHHAARMLYSILDIANCHPLRCLDTQKCNHSNHTRATHNKLDKLWVVATIATCTSCTHPPSAGQETSRSSNTNNKQRGTNANCTS